MTLQQTLSIGVLATFLLVAGFGGEAQADPALSRLGGSVKPTKVNTTWDRKGVSRAEQAYADQVGLALGSERPIDNIVRFESRYPSAVGPGIARGVMFQFGPDDMMSRIRFPSAAAAQEYALLIHDAGDDEYSRQAIQVRGNQVLVATGPSLDSPKYVARVLRAGWEGLPHADQPVDTTLVFMDDTFAVVSRLDDPALERAFQGLAQGDQAETALGGKQRAAWRYTRGEEQREAFERLVNDLRGVIGKVTCDPIPTFPFPFPACPGGSAPKPEATPRSATVPGMLKQGLSDQLRRLGSIRK